MTMPLMVITATYRARTRQESKHPDINLIYLNRSSNRGRESSEQGSVSKTPGQGDSESEKGSPGAPQSSSNQPKAKASQLSQGPELLLIKLQEKANIQFPEDRSKLILSIFGLTLTRTRCFLECCQPAKFHSESARRR
jgi:hypothetical protein